MEAWKLSGYYSTTTLMVEPHGAEISQQLHLETFWLLLRISHFLLLDVGHVF